MFLPKFTIVISSKQNSVIDISDSPAKMIGIASGILQSLDRPEKDHSRLG